MFQELILMVANCSMHASASSHPQQSKGIHLIQTFMPWCRIDAVLGGWLWMLDMGDIMCSYIWPSAGEVGALKVCER